MNKVSRRSSKKDFVEKWGCLWKSNRLIYDLIGRDL